MNLFPSTPSLHRADRERLAAHLGNARELKRWIREDKPSTADLKRCIVIEVERGPRMRNDVILSLLVAIQRYERSAIERRIIQANERIIRKNKKG